MNLWSMRKLIEQRRHSTLKKRATITLILSYFLFYSAGCYITDWRIACSCAFLATISGIISFSSWVALDE